MSDRLFPVPELAAEAPVKLTATQRLTARRRDLLAAGKHPATGMKVIDNGSTCGDCEHHHSHEHYSSRPKVWHKCDVHRLGESHSEASDIRVSWPACELWKAES